MLHLPHNPDHFQLADSRKFVTERRVLLKFGEFSDTAVHYPPKGSRCACHSQRRVSVLCAAVDVCGVLLVISKLLVSLLVLLLVLLVIAFHMSKFES